MQCYIHMSQYYNISHFNDILKVTWSISQCFLACQSLFLDWWRILRQIWTLVFHYLTHLCTVSLVSVFTTLSLVQRGLSGSGDECAVHFLCCGSASRPFLVSVTHSCMLKRSHVQFLSENMNATSALVSFRSTCLLYSVSVEWMNLMLFYLVYMIDGCCIFFVL